MSQSKLYLSVHTKFSDQAFQIKEAEFEESRKKCAALGTVQLQ